MKNKEKLSGIQTLLNAIVFELNQNKPDMMEVLNNYKQIAKWAKELSLMRKGGK